jgi:hypothetical protein
MRSKYYTLSRDMDQSQLPMDGTLNLQHNCLKNCELISEHNRADQHGQGEKSEEGKKEGV